MIQTEALVVRYLNNMKMGFSFEKLPDTVLEKCLNSHEEHIERATCVAYMGAMGADAGVGVGVGVGTVPPRLRRRYP